MNNMASINRENERFWFKQSAIMMKQIVDPELFAEAIAEIQALERSGTPLYSRKCLGVALAEAAARRDEREAADGTAPTARQRRYARRPRNIVDEDGTTIGQLVELLLLEPKNASLSKTKLWDVLLTKLADRGCEPVEPRIPNISGYYFVYQFKGRRKTMTFKTFCNLVCRFRRKT